jgi:outer membrane protein assembly factor BamB
MKESSSLSVKDCIKQVSIIVDRPTIARNGAQQAWLLDLRPILLNRHCLSEIATAFWSVYSDRPRFQVATIETAAIPLLTAIILLAPPERGPLNGFVVRKERKATGRGNLIEGSVTEDPIILVDDTLNSGGSIEKAFAVLAAERRYVADLFVVVDFRSQAGLAWRRHRSVEVQSLYSLSDFGLQLGKRVPPKTAQYRTLWHAKVEGGSPFHVVPKSAPVLVGNSLFRGSDSGQFQCFDASTGRITWTFAVRTKSPHKGIWSTPAVHAGRVYFGAYNGTFYCLDAKTGDEIWSRSCCEWIGASPLVLPHHDIVCIGLEFERPEMQGGLAALRMTSGEVVWQRPVGKLQHGSAAYWAKGDLVVWGTADHETVALRAITGEVVWSLPTQRSVKYAPAIDDRHGVTAFASFDKSIYLADLRDGTVLAEWKTDDICYTTPLILGDKLFCGSADHRLYIADVPRRKLLARLDTGSRIFASPVAIGNRVLFGTTGGKLIELDADTLQVKAITQLPDAITNAVAVSENGRRVYASTAMNDLYALERA